MKRIAAHRFTYETHCGANSYSIFVLWDFDKHVPKPEWETVGYCKASALPFRANDRDYAIMLERVKEDSIWGTGEIGEKIWLHVRYRDLKDFQDYCDKK